jgi:hypothetical protein
MSIILRALKKLQEEKAKQTDDVSPEVTEKNDVAAGSESIPSAADPMDAENDVASDSIAADIEWAPYHSQRQPPEQQEARQAFGLGPKALLILVLLLGVFTTGWFTNRIYLSTKTAPDKEQPAARIDMQKTPQPPKPAAAVSARAKPSAAVGKATPVADTSVQVTEAPPAAQKSEPAAKKAPPKSAVPATESQPPRQKTPVAEKPAPENQGRPELKINAIAWRIEEPKAIVNMQRVYEGDIIEGATIVAIQRKAILFEYEGEPFEVRF